MIRRVEDSQAWIGGVKSFMPSIKNWLVLYDKVSHGDLFSDIYDQQECYKARLIAAKMDFEKRTTRYIDIDSYLIDEGDGEDFCVTEIDGEKQFASYLELISFLDGDAVREVLDTIKEIRSAPRGYLKRLQSAL